MFCPDMKKLLFALLLFYNVSYSQSAAGVWYFGNQAGINFNLGSNPVALFDSQMQTFEGCATLCDDFGTLLFYTDGLSIWNKNHVLMPNGTGLLGDSSSTQSAIIVPMPGSTTKYYVFTVTELAKPSGLRYNIVDMTLEGGTGDVITKNIALLTPTAEKINVVKHANDNDYWVISHKFNNSEFYAYLISPSGISAPVISSVGEIIGGSTQNSLGYLKSSPDGKFIASANSKPLNSNLQIFNFNTTTGGLSLISTTSFPNSTDGIGVYGVEFSNTSNLLYVTNIDYANKKSQLYQFNLEVPTETAINNSKVLLGEFTGTEVGKGAFGALQLAPNKKIYMARNGLNYIGAINNPDVYGTGSNFSANAFSLGDKISSFGLPAFVTSLFDISYRFSNTCLGDATQFEIPQSATNLIAINWDFGDPTSPSNTSNIANPSHVFSSTGEFSVTLTVQTPASTKTYTRTVTIVETPIANQPSDFITCSDENFESFDLLQKTPEVLGTQSAATYQVSYFSTLEDAENNENQLPNTFTNTANPQTIYARIQALNGSDCFDITDFDIIVNKNPRLQDDATLFYCLDTFPVTISLGAGNLNPSMALTYLWSTGQTTQNIAINTPGIYTVEATNNNGCSSIRTITVASAEIATINYTLQGSIGNYSIVINATGTGNYLYALDYENGAYQSNNVFYNIAPGQHTIYVKDENCGSSEASFSVIGFPNFFSPNADGVNDRWNIIGNRDNVREINIFDRYGKLVYNFPFDRFGWDGTFNGQKLPATDYWFYAKMVSGEEVRGHFSLIR